MRTVQVKAFAKINLGLKVLGIRHDGFHELRTIYQIISLFDSLEVGVSRGAKGGNVTLSAEGIEVPGGEDNLAVRAAWAMCSAAARDARVNIHLHKRIPTGGGLGGGSSDAAAVIRALRVLIGKRLPAGKVFQIAAGLGSDVPFFLFGGRAIGVGRGEEVYPLADGPARHCVVALPDAGMSTAEAYQALQAPEWPVGGSRPARRLARIEPQPSILTFCSTLLEEAEVASTLPQNDFEPLLLAKFPQLRLARSALRDCGSFFASLTGSGSAMYGLFRTRPEASRAYQKLKASGMRTYLTRTVGRLEYARSLKLS